MVSKAKRTLSEAADNQLSANKFWKILKVAILTGKKFLFKIEEGVMLSYDEETRTATFKIDPAFSIRHDVDPEFYKDITSIEPPQEVEN